MTNESVAVSENGPITMKCWGCGAHPSGCIKCGGTGRIFWAYGISFPYTPEGEKRALKFIEREESKDYD